jgi:hypothetical protein
MKYLAIALLGCSMAAMAQAPGFGCRDNRFQSLPTNQWSSPLPGCA